MKKRQLEILKERVELLNRAHKSLYDATLDNRKNTDVVDSLSELLTGCQTIAINMGTLIEESEGEGFITVKYLEEYCELVYSVNEELCNTESSYNPDKISKKLNKMILKIENSIKHDIPLKREAVFLPYKASMWDSLESVWEAADEDPDCDAYVIPIPYFDKNPDGSVREEHYEADLFPENVPITHYSEYDFGQHHPDMIFIHNPYDYGNLVTTIHPFFYAENMKKVTDCLVYIPYFATSGGMSESRAWCPVYDYVDYIVIQSENYRKYYSADIPDEKFLALGSPKFDKVIKKCQNPPEISEEWKKKTEGRRVFFYNTSLNGMLQDTPQFLKKMQYVFETFKKHPECCLLWRPHPLFESTLHAMRPGCIEVFDALKQDFMKQSNWIYDDTPCVEDTIAICDGYIGDSMSSVVALFEVAKKPIFILDNAISSEPDEESWRNYAYYRPLKGENIGIQKYITTFSNKLFKLDEEKKEFLFLRDLSDYSQEAKVFVVVEYNNMLYTFSRNSLTINRISLDGNECIIQIKDEFISKLAFFDFYKSGKYIYMIPCDYPSLVVFDMDNEELIYIEIDPGFSVNTFENNRYMAPVWVSEQNLYILGNNGNELLTINAQSRNKRKINIGLNKLYYSANINAENKNEVWLMPYEGTVIEKINYINFKKEKYEFNYEQLTAKNRISLEESKNNLFAGCYSSGDAIIALPYWGNSIVKRDLLSGYVSKCYEEIDCDYHKMSYRKSNTVGEYVNNGLNLYWHYYTNNIYSFENGALKLFEYGFNKDDLIKNHDKFKRFNECLGYVCFEDWFNSLEIIINGDLLGYYNTEIAEEDILLINSSPNGDCGENVYRLVKEGKNGR